MDNFYSRQAIMLDFTGHACQRGSGFGSLATGVGRIALPFARKVLLPAVQSIGKELFEQKSPETLEVTVTTKKKSFKQAAKVALKKTVKKQIGGSGRRKNRNIRQKRELQRSRSDLFSKFKNVS